MPRLAIAAAVASLAFATSPAMAAAIPLADLSCKQFTDYNKDNTMIILNWLDGFYADKDAAPVIDFDRMGQNGKKLEEYCKVNPDAPMSKAAEKVMGQ
jgi:acid stress chaperone HdeB